MLLTMFLLFLLSSSAEKSRRKLEILRDINGERKGTVYEYGLAESENEEEFLLKLKSLETKWESLCSGFFKWFYDHRISKFVDSVIYSRNGIIISDSRLEKPAGLPCKSDCKIIRIYFRMFCLCFVSIFSVKLKSCTNHLSSGFRIFSTSE